MGLGHTRAAYALKKLSNNEILIYGSKRVTPRKEYMIWKRIKKIYYFISRVSDFPLIGKLVLYPMLAFQKIPPYYPVKNYSKPNYAVRYLDRLIKKRSLCTALNKRMKGKKMAFVHTFYATAIAMDLDTEKNWSNYLLITDTDFNRVWVPKEPSKSKIKFLTPNTQVKNRLLSYGITKENIYLTGFPLPVENIGTYEGLEILKEDLWRRLLRLDPTNKFFSFHQKSVFHWLKKRKIPKQREKHLSLMFAIGGSGVQTRMVETILNSLKKKIICGEVHLYLSAGIQKKVFETLTAFIRKLNIQKYLNRNLFLIFDLQIYEYFKKFNRALRQTDVLWTKPSELSFYCGLGIPILIAPPIGTHEELNARWLSEIHTGLKPPGSLEYTHQWLFDLRNNGRLAEAAWDGFLKARKLGSYKIKELIEKGNFCESQHPMEQ